MNSYAVSIEFISSEQELSAICAVLGKETTPDSYSIGDRRGKGVAKNSCLRFFSNAPETASVLEHFAEARTLAGQVEGISREGLKRLLSIAVFFSVPMTTFSIPNEVVRWAAEHGFELEVSCYPSQGE